MRHWLAFGLTGAVGTALQAGGRAGDVRITAVSRGRPAAREGVRWCGGDLATWRPAAGDGFDAIASLGPLDAFARWYERVAPSAPRVVALGSTSVHAKRDSADPAERALAATLADAEARLEAACAARGAVLTLLRPTLIYGVGRDRNLSRIVGLARRWHVVPLPGTATGRRQPVHAGDVAAAVAAALARPVAGRFDLPGGETVRYDEMVRRTLAAGAPGARIVRVPTAVVRTALGVGRLLGRFPDTGGAMVDRLAQDLVYDGSPVRAALGIAPRMFVPTRSMFPD